MSDKQLQNSFTTEYKQWLNEIKQKFQSSQIKASIQVNNILLEFYWNLGNEIVEKQKNSTWGSGFLQQLSIDLSAEFPDVKGFSYTNIKNIRQWFLFWQRVTNIPDGINRTISVKGVIINCRTKYRLHYW